MTFEAIPPADRRDWRLLITGGSGFIGTAAVMHYRRCGATILNLDIAPPLLGDQAEHWRKQDILDYPRLLKAFADFQPTHVLHLAARTDLDERKEISGYAANTDGTQTVLDAVKVTSTIRRLIVASTMFVCEPGYRPISDTDYRPHTVYGQSKVVTEQLTRKANLSCTWSLVRPAVIWGPYHERLRHGFFGILRRGLYFHPGGRPAHRSYGYIGNSIFQIDRIFSVDPAKVNSKVFYLADPPVNLLEWTDGFSRELLGRPVRRIPYSVLRGLGRVGDVMVRLGAGNFPMTTFRLRNMTSDNIVDTGSINAVATSLPYSMLDGIRETVNWLREANGDRPS